MRTKLGYILLGAIPLGLIALLVFNPMMFLVILLSGFVIIVSVLLFRPAKPDFYKPAHKIAADDEDSLEDDIRHHDYGYGGFGTDSDEKHN